MANGPKWTPNVFLTFMRRAVEFSHAHCGFQTNITKERPRKICHGWGEAKANDLARLLDGRQLVVVHVQELYDAWKLGLI